jgi:hypothetical protein
VENKLDIWIKQTDEILKNWSQGDCVLGESWFIHRFNPKQPLTEPSQDAVNQEPEIDLAEDEVRGFAIVTQTCDLVRSCRDRPFVEVVPLVEVDKQLLSEIKKARRPQFAYISGVAELNLVADLDRVMTIEKAVVAEWKRERGCLNDEEIRALGLALARKRARFAFPDEFIKFVSKLQKRLKDKHDKNSDEGSALRALREIRVRANPNWNDSQVELMFWFIRDQEQLDWRGSQWNELLEKWLELIPKTDLFHKVEGSVVALEDITAKDYIESDPLDLDYLSL